MAAPFGRSSAWVITVRAARVAGHLWAGEEKVAWTAKRLNASRVLVVIRRDESFGYASTQNDPFTQGSLLGQPSWVLKDASPIDLAQSGYKLGFGYALWLQSCQHFLPWQATKTHWQHFQASPKPVKTSNVIHLADQIRKNLNLTQSQTASVYLFNVVMYGFNCPAISVRPPCCAPWPTMASYWLSKRLSALRTFESEAKLEGAVKIWRDVPSEIV